MAQTNFLDDVKVAKENEYFHRQEQELLEKMRVRAKLEAEQTVMDEALATADEELTMSLKEMGFNR